MEVERRDDAILCSVMAFEGPASTQESVNLLKAVHFLDRIGYATRTSDHRISDRVGRSRFDLGRKPRDASCGSSNMSVTTS